MVVKMFIDEILYHYFDVTSTDERNRKSLLTFSCPQSHLKIQK